MPPTASRSSLSRSLAWRCARNGREVRTRSALQSCERSLFTCLVRVGDREGHFPSVTKSRVKPSSSATRAVGSARVEALVCRCCRSHVNGREPAGERVSRRAWLILRHEVPGSRQRNETRGRNRRGEASANIQRKPPVILPPENEGGGVDLPIPRFDLVRIPPVKLRNLQVVGCLAAGTA